MFVVHGFYVLICSCTGFFTIDKLANSVVKFDSFIINSKCNSRIMGRKRNAIQQKRKATVLKKGVRVTSQTKVVVENVRRYFGALKGKGHSHGLNIVKRTVEATGLSEASVKRIHKEYLSRENQFFTPVTRLTNLDAVLL